MKNKDQLLLIDLGTYHLRFAFSNENDISKPVFCALNCIIKNTKTKQKSFSNQLNEQLDPRAVKLLKPMDLGYLTNTSIQKDIFENFIFSKTLESVEFYPSSNPAVKEHQNTRKLKGSIPTRSGNESSSNTTTPVSSEYKRLDPLEKFKVIITENLFSIPPTQEHLNDLFIEDFPADQVNFNDPKLFVLFLRKSIFNSINFGFPRKFKNPEAFSDADEEFSILDSGKACVIVDSGHSYTRVLLLKTNGKGRKVLDTKLHRQIDVGGSLMSEYLGKFLDLQKKDLSKEKLLIDDIKETYSEVPLFNEETKGPREEKIFVLPNGYDVSRGFPLGSSDKNAREEEKDKYFNEEAYDRVKLEFQTDRTSEALFVPTNLQVFQRGLAETIRDLLIEEEEVVQREALENIFCVGGCFNIPNTALRLTLELKKMFSQDFTVCVHFRNDTETKESVEREVSKFKKSSQEANGECDIGIQVFEAIEESSRIIPAEELTFLGMMEFLKGEKKDKFFISAKELKSMDVEDSRKKMCFLEII